MTFGQSLSVLNNLSTPSPPHPPLQQTPQRTLDAVNKATVLPRLASIPHHNTTEGRVLSTSLLNDVTESSDVDIATTSSWWCGRCSDVNLDILVWWGVLCPVIPKGRYEVMSIWLSQVYERTSQRSSMHWGCWNWWDHRSCYLRKQW